ncbi:hypothetical protein [Porphyromonas gingivalis]|uniref:Uncharacterized protein n=2 Tax=Nixviridae TaxID=3424665 RepID=A0AAT9J9V3_9CAUD|nr:hypothetical protein [Porphyromonas gingivalis]ATR92721.1 hypothetical protein CS545_06360 [Porphyromonas gingivalis]
MATTKHYNVYVRGEFVCDTWQKNKKEAIDVAYFHYGYGYEKKDFTAELSDDQQDGPYLVAPNGRRLPVESKQ